MQFEPSVINELTNDLAGRADGGTLSLYEGTAPNSPTEGIDAFQEPLVVIQLPSPAFQLAINGKAKGITPKPARIAMTGEATWARLRSSGDQTLADLTVTDGSEPGDLEIDSVHLHRTGELVVSNFSLTLRVQAS